MLVGGACKWLDTDGNNVPEANFRVTTVSKLSSLNTQERYECLYDIVKNNLAALSMQIVLVGVGPDATKMWRIGSDILPMYTHPVAKEFYRDPDIRNLIDEYLAKCGEMARKFNVRLSFHPGQFVVLGSQNQGIRENSIRELKYHAEVFSRMGYSGWHPDGLAINVHVGVKEANITEMRKLLRSDKDILNFVTLENDEFSWGTQAIVENFGDLVPVVLDVHHHWIHTGKRLEPDSRLVSEIRDTWWGTQPKLHLSMSDPVLCTVEPDGDIKLPKLLKLGATRSGLRAHSQHPWHTPSINYAGAFGFDIMWEGKDKNLGAAAIATELGLMY